MDPRPTDEQLARQAQDGCSASFEELVRRFQVPLLHFLQRRMRQDAEDVTQETFVRAYQNIHRYNSQWRFGTWLYTIGRRLSMNHHRRRRPAADSPSLESMEARGPLPSQVAADTENRTLLWDLADKVLTERQMTAMWLYYIQEMPIEEVAHVVGSRRGAVKTMLFRARRKLFSAVEERFSSDATELRTETNRQPQEPEPNPAPNAPNTPKTVLGTSNG